MNPNPNLLKTQDALALTQFSLLKLAEYARMRGLLVEWGMDDPLADACRREMKRIKRQLVDIPWAMEFIK